MAKKKIYLMLEFSNKDLIEVWFKNVLLNIASGYEEGINCGDYEDDQAKAEWLQGLFTTKDLISQIEDESHIKIIDL